MTNYVSVFNCVGCKLQLSKKQMLYSDGICPHCGYASAGTICDSIKTSVPEVEVETFAVAREENGIKKSVSVFILGVFIGFTFTSLIWVLK